MNNAAIAGLLAVLVFVVLASVCAFPFLNCAKREKFSTDIKKVTRAYADRKCPKLVGVSIILRSSTKPEHRCCEWSKEYKLDTGTAHVFFKAGNQFENGVRYKVNFKAANGNKIKETRPNEFESDNNGELIPSSNVIRQATSFWLTRVYPPLPNPPLPGSPGTPGSPGSPVPFNCKNGTFTYTMTRSTGKPPVTACLPNPGEEMMLSKEIVSMTFDPKGNVGIALFKSDRRLIDTFYGKKTLDIGWLNSKTPSYWKVG
jgi:hypothetical protein